MRAPVILITTTSIVIAKLSERLILSYWRMTPSLLDIMKVGEVLDDHRAQAPGPVADLVIIDQRVGIPDDVIRQRLSRKTRERDPKTMGSVIVYEGTGFFAASVRSVITAIKIAARIRTPMRVVASVSEAAAMCKSEGWSELSPDDIVRAVEVVRAQLRSDART